MSEAFGEILTAYLAGGISPEIALARLVLLGMDGQDIIVALSRAAGSDQRYDGLTRLAEEKRQALDDTAALIREAGLGHTDSGPDCLANIDRIADLFDRAVIRAPESSVALYALDDPSILDRATTELVSWLEAEALIGKGVDVLDIGCGIGRFAASLSSKVRSVLGIDVSKNMIAEANRRNGHLAGVSFLRTAGSDLSGLPSRSFGLVLAVDVFPYLVQAGGDVAERHMRDIGRILRPGGALAIFNLSYRSEPGADLADARAWASMTGMTLCQAGISPFRLWDGRGFVFRAPRSRTVGRDIAPPAL